MFFIFISNEGCSYFPVNGAAAGKPYVQTDDIELIEGFLPPE